MNLAEYQQVKSIATGLLPFLVFCLGFSAGAQQFMPQQVIDPAVFGITKIITTDLDNDGFRDIIISQKYTDNNKISYFLNSGSGSFGPENILTTNVKSSEGIAAGDLDGNGWADIVAISYNPNQLLFFPNSGGNFPSEILLDPDLIFPEEVEIIDVDNNGSLDIVVLDHFNILVYYNDGNGTFTKAITPNDDQFEYYAFSIADLDGDGFKDIIIGGTFLLVYMNDNGSFVDRDIPRGNSLTNNGFCFTVHTADLDGNGSMDLIVDGNGNSEINWYSNDGNGFFSFMQSIETTLQCKSVSTADFDQDGSLDLFASLYQEGEVAWYANNGQGVFGNKQLIATSNTASTIVTASADLDNNGSADVIWGHPFSFNLNNSLGLDSHSNIQAVIRVLPNPFQEQVLIHSQERSNLTIFDIQGRRIYQNIPIEAGTQTFSRNLPPQLYFFEFTTASQVFVKKIVKK